MKTEISRPMAILFDLDGTLVDSFQAIRGTVNLIRGEHGLGPLDEASVRAAVGEGVRRLLERTAPIGEVEENVATFLSRHPSFIRRGTRVLPGVRRTLGALRNRGVRLGVCSNKPLPLTRRLLREMRLGEFFELALGPESVKRTKPAPDMLLVAADRLKIPPDQILYVGDMRIDIRTARSAGMPVWVIPTGPEPEETLRAARPDRVMERFNELLAVAPRRPK